VGNGPTNGVDPSGMAEKKDRIWIVDPRVNDVPPQKISGGATLGGIHVTVPDKRVVEYYLKYGSLDGIPIRNSPNPSVEVIKIIVRTAGRSKRSYDHTESSSVGTLHFVDQCPLGFVDGTARRGYGFEVEILYRGDKDKLRIEQWLSGTMTNEWSLLATTHPENDIRDKGGFTVQKGNKWFGLDFSVPGRDFFVDRTIGRISYYDFPHWPMSLFPGPYGHILLHVLVVAYPADLSSKPVVADFYIGRDPEMESRMHVILMSLHATQEVIPQFPQCGNGVKVFTKDGKVD